MDHPDLTVSNLMEDSIGLKRVKIYLNDNKLLCVSVRIFVTVLFVECLIVNFQMQYILRSAWAFAQSYQHE